MATRPRSVLASAIGWIRFVLRSIAWFVLIALLLVVYFAVRTPDD